MSDHDQAGPHIPLVHAEGAPGFEEARARVGVVPFLVAGDLYAAIVAKVTIATADLAGRAFRGVPRVETAPRPLVRGAPCRFAPKDPASRDACDDMVPGKGALDILVAGHAATPEPASTVAVRVVAGPVDTSFVVTAAARTDGIPITVAAVPPPHAAPRPSPRPFAEPPHVPALDALAGFNAAPRAFQAPIGAVAPDAVLVLTGLSGGGEARVTLPGLAPHALVTLVGEEVEVPMALDTLAIDADDGTIDLTFRGRLPIGMQTIDAIQAVTVALDKRGAERTAAERASACMRGDVTWAATPGCLERDVDPDDPRIEGARLATLAAVAPEPRLPLRDFATISAEIAEEPGQRAEVLRRRDIPPWRWMVEERAWLERMAHLSLRGDPAVAAAFGAHYLAAENALARPEEDEVRLRDYAEARVALERSRDPSETLEQLRWSMPRYARVERRWLAAADADPRIADALAAYLDELRAAAPGDDA